jgi:hypothetical protein
MAVVAVARSIWAEVKKAVALSGTQGALHCVAFPGVGRQREFLNDMAALLPRLLPELQTSGEHA